MRSPKERTDGRAARCVAMRPNSTSARPPLAAFFTSSRSASFTDCTWAAAGPVRAISATATKLMMVSAFMHVPPRVDARRKTSATEVRYSGPGPPARRESAVRENRLKTMWKRGETVVNGWLAIPTGFTAEVMAHQGFDSLTVDMQHGVVDYQTAVSMLQGISTTGVMPLARVPWNDPARLMKILDAGAYGVICPMINTRAQAEALVAACKYPPLGYRSFGPVRASIYAGSDYAERANDDIVVMPMIETAEALKNLDAILSTPGVDAIYVGPADLSLALGCKPRLDQTDAPVVQAQQQIVEACKRHNVVAGIHNATAAYALKMIAAGYRFVTLASDTRHLAMKAAEEVAAVRKGVGGGVLPAY